MSDKMPQIGDFCWNELMTPDPKKAKEFYGALLGWKSTDHDMGNMVYTMFRNGEKDIAGMLQTPKGQENQIPPHWMSYINVANVDDMVKKAQSLGAKITVPATVVSDYGKFAVIQDTTGAHIALWQSLKSC